jgi:hypothetical protein
MTELIIAIAIANLGWIAWWIVWAIITLPLIWLSGKVIDWLYD